MVNVFRLVLDAASRYKFGCTPLFKKIIFVSMLCCSFINTSYANDSLTQLEQVLADNKGKVVFIDFWASWCDPCRQSFPWLNKIHANYQEQGFIVVSVNLDAEHDNAAKFLKQTPANFDVIYDPKGLVARKFKVKGMPSSYLVNRDGKFVATHIGFFEGKIEEYEQEILALLAN